MKIVCNRLLLAEAIAGVSRAVTQKSNIPVLEGILFKTAQNAVVLTGYDLEMGITTLIEAEVKKEGEIVLSAKLLGDMVRRVNSDIIEIETEENCTTVIKGGITEFSILGMPAIDYPELPAPGAEPVLTMEGSVLKEMIDTTLYAVSQDDKKPAHTGELFVIEESKITLVALDGYRLAICEREVKANKEIQIIVPAKTMSEIAKIIDDSHDEIEVSANRRYIVCTTGRYTIVSRLIEGEFLDYKNVLPKQCETRVQIKVRDFINSIERASLIITERLKNPLRIHFGETVVVRCQTAIGKVVDEFEAKVTGKEIEIGFNNRYLLDALRYTGDDEVIFELSGPLSPVKVIPVKGNAFTFLVLPVRFKND